MVTIARLRSLMSQVLHLDEPPHRTALAFAIGAFIAFTPTYGLHTLTVVLFAWAFRFNALALFAGAAINNPWTVIPILGATIWTGFRLMGTTTIPSFHWGDLSLQSLYGQIMPYVVPFFVGGIALSILSAVVSYPAAYFLIITYRSRGTQGRPLG
jgi:uncharacterized protein